MSEENALRVALLVKSNRYLTMASQSVQEGAWATPVAYYYDRNLNFYFYSEITSRHARHIDESDDVAFSIYNSSLPSADVDGMQVAASCHQVPDHELPPIYNGYFEQSFPDPVERAKWQKPIDRFSGKSQLKFYRIVPRKIYVIDLEYSDADRRVEVPLSGILPHFR